MENILSYFHIAGGYNNPEHFEDFHYGWKSILAQKMPLVCYRQGSDEIVGVNWVFVSSEEDNFLEKLNENVKINTLHFICDFMQEDFFPILLSVFAVQKCPI